MAPATASAFARAARPLFHQATFAAQARSAFRRSAGGRRFQSTTAGPQPSFFKRMWDSPIGLKTVHFWCVALPPSLCVCVCVAWAG